MANNVAITAGSGTTISTDDLTASAPGGHVQLVKLVLGAKDAYQATLARGGDVMANGLPVALASDQRLGAKAATTGTVTTSGGLSVTATALDGYPAVLVSFSGTYAAHVQYFEASDDGGSTWYPVSAMRIDMPIAYSAMGMVADAEVAFHVNILGATQFRTRAGANLSSGTVNVRISPIGVSIPQQPPGALPAILKTALFDLNADLNVIAGIAGRRIRVYGLTIQARGTTSFKLIDTAVSPADLTKQIDFQAREGLVQSVLPPAYLFETATGEGVKFDNVSGTGMVFGLLQYCEIPV